MNLRIKRGLMNVRGHGAHMWICGAMIVVALVAVAVTGNAFVLLPALGCLVMMAMMMWMMGSMMGGPRLTDSDDATQSEHEAHRH